MLAKYVKFDIHFSLNQLDGVDMLSYSNEEKSIYAWSTKLENTRQNRRLRLENKE